MIFGEDRGLKEDGRRRTLLEGLKTIKVEDFLINFRIIN